MLQFLFVKRLLISDKVAKEADLTGAFNPLTAIIFAGVIGAALLYVAYSICGAGSGSTRMSDAQSGIAFIMPKTRHS